MAHGSPPIVVEVLLRLCAGRPSRGLCTQCPFHVTWTIHILGTSWVPCRIKSTLLASAHVACATARSLRKGGNLTDSKSFIMALHSRRPSELSTGLVDLLLADCIDEATPFPPPQHLYSHQEGTFLDLDG